MLRRFACLATLLVACSVHARDFRVGDIVIADAWTRPTATGMPMGVAYFTLTNLGRTADALIAASTPLAARAEIHETSIVEGMARMRPLGEIGLAAGQRVAVAPGGIHLMLVGLKAPLAAGTRVPLTLEFRAAGRVTIELTVTARTQ
jgi:periplasmic copper chaperone A